MRSRVVVTGGRGFIGGPVCDELTKRGFEPDIFGLEEGGIEDANRVYDFVEGAEFVIHLAGVLGTHELFDSVRQAIDINVKGTVNVLDACWRHNACYVGITMPQVFPSVYTATKVAATKLATAYHYNFGLGVSHVRAFNAFGPGQAYGPGHPQKIVPTFAIKALRGEPIPIWGDGEQGVDLIHTSDLAIMLVDASQFTDDQVFDGGTGQSFTVNEVADMIKEIAGSKAPNEYLPMRRGEAPTQIVATGEGWDTLGWQPRFRHRDLVDTVNWYASRLENFP
jgi:UDP-glucose 4-epimerase